MNEKTERKNGGVFERSGRIRRALNVHGREQAALTLMGRERQTTTIGEGAEHQLFLL